MEGAFTKEFVNGPPICVSIWVSRDQVERITLAFAENFSMFIRGNGSQKLMDQIADWISSYSKKKKAPLPPLNLSKISPFYQTTLKNLAAVPLGKKLSYQRLAQTSGSPKASRAVGSACKKNPFPLMIPCHRVVRSDNSLGNFLYGQSMKKELLVFENAL